MTVLFMGTLLFLSLGILSSILCYQLAHQRDLIVQRLSILNPNFSPKSTSLFAFLPTLKVNKKLNIQLLRAGFNNDNASLYFRLFKLVFMLLCFGAYLGYKHFSLTSLVLAEAAIVAMISGMVCERWLIARAKRITSNIALATPDALDLMVICVESGLTLEAMFGRVGQEMYQICPELSRQWLITEVELRLLEPRSRALKNLANRCAVVEIENLVISLSQAEKYGGSIAQTLRLIATDSRQKQYLSLEEKVGKIPAKMALPLVLLVMLPVVVLIVAPTFISLLSTLGEL
ncbi:Flp pilus assembly protein TadC [Psychromonas sp. CNPT3]|uniref:type II secretion system F family protein n=1 Tax=Psychromonas sp. CNPT3 TaxID=314282 RepID=UPI00006E70B5|nr:type II secretion system F family protein [Psychromonas sp. CNPT3]AGH80110.1 Flp pilus assembly protein TadC [Psychromonas sp. CNPT3]